MDSDSDVMMMDEEESDFDVFSEADDEENYAPTKTKKKAAAVSKKAAPKKKAAAPKKKAPVADDSDIDDDDDEDDFSVLSSTAANAGKKTKTVEEKYQKKSQIEHILHRPDTYVGSLDRITRNMFVLNEDDRIVEKEITYTPGLYKIFDEIVVNAADNKQRDPNMDLLDITVDAEANKISVKNNGQGIPVVMHKEHKCYVPTLIFGHLLTGSNFDDDEKKTTGGRNGYGAKLANVFSTEFIVECVDTERGLKFRQVFRQNMRVAEEPTIAKISASQKKAGDWVKITFSPDLPRFHMEHLDDDAKALLSKRAYDIAGTMASRGGKKLKVSLNGKKLPVKNFKEYIAKFENVNPPVAYANDDKWEVGVSWSEDNTLTQISFVNAISTSKGGNHVTYIADQVGNHLVQFFKKKKKTELKKSQIVNHLAVMVNALIENPTFDSQSKDELTSTKKKFGSKFELPPEFFKKIEKSDMIDKILRYNSFKEREQLKKKGGKKKINLTGISKLDDANYAGSAKSKDCTLIITEGDSAKSLAMAGVSVVGRDYYGVFPLKGKVLNVREMDDKKASNNEEVKNLVSILGLKFYKTYDETNIKELRYGHLLIMADQDTDGSHIKGLIINFLHHFWPSLLDVPGFLQQFITPIVKVTKGKKTKTFFTIPEYEQWRESTGNNGKGYSIKYYKGLGTSTSVEAKQYFSNLDVHQVNFAPISNDTFKRAEFYEEDDELAELLPDTASDLIDMVFKKDRVDDRKQWLMSTKTKDVFADYKASGEEGMQFSEFLNKEYVLFSNYDNVRSLPSLMDGFKPSQRKVLFGCLKRKLTKNDIKVAQLTGYIAEHSAYHHGEQSLQGTIINMAQNFVGSNNINLLTPSGQFGTRRMGGHDAASPRYIFTKLEPITRTIFHPDDDALLAYKNDDGLSIEPEYYVPVIPMILVNGASGIGTGWSCNVVNYNPREIIANLRRLIAGEEMEPLTPFYSGYTGEITLQSKGKYAVKGKIERIDDTKLLITELPLKKWTQNYKEFLEAMIVGDSKAGKLPELKEMKENHTETTVSFTITAEKAKIDEFEKEKKGLYGKFKLTGSLATSNMTMHDAEHRIVKYTTPEEIMQAFYDVRLDFYGKRKDSLIRRLEAEKKMLSNKVRFIEEVCAGTLVVSNRKRKDILEDLQEHGYDLITNDQKKGDKSDGDEESEDDDEADDEPTTAELARGYEYLLGLKIWSLTYEKAEQLRAEFEEKSHELDTLLATDPSEIWLHDLDEIENALDERDAAFNAANKEESIARKKSQKRQVKKKKTNGKKKKKDEWDSDMESDEDDEMSVSSFEDQVVVVAKKKKPVARSKAIKKPAAKKAPVAKAVAAPVAPSALAASPAKKPSFDDSESDDDMGLSLGDRLKKKLVVSPPPAKKRDSSGSSGSNGSKKRASPLILKSDDDGVDEFEFMSSDKPKTLKAKRSAAAAPMRKPKAKGKKATSFDDDSDSDDEFAFRSSGDEDIVAARAAPARASRRTVPVKTYSYDESDDDDEEAEFSDDFDEEDDE